MHVPFKIHYRNNLIDKKDSYLIPRPPSWDDRNCSYGHQLYPSVHCRKIFNLSVLAAKQSESLDRASRFWLFLKLVQINFIFSGKVHVLYI